MPAKLIRCANCRALLNAELTPRTIESPDFVPLQEVLTVLDADVRGDFVACPNCTRELRVSGKFRGQRVSCRYCDHAFELLVGTVKVKRMAVYATCPHCQQELRSAEKFLGVNVACKFCGGAIRIVDIPHAGPAA